MLFIVFFFKQKTAYEMRISDLSSDVCSSDLILGLAFDDTGKLWNQEMGPKGGDEVNLVAAKANYGYPIVSNGDHYDGKDIPDHPTRPEFAAPKLWWNPAISPAGLAFYGGDLYPGWKTSLLMGALSGANGRAACGGRVCRYVLSAGG